MQTKVIRHNQDNNNGATFTTSFNSSSIYSKAVKSGEAMLHVKMAIEYPEKYRREQNWFETSALLKVQDKLAISVPEFIPNSDKQTHLYLLPPSTLSKISTNKNTRMKMGYSMQSVYDYTTKKYEYQESKTPIIQLVNDHSIQTFDKYGKVTVIIEERQASSDQLVMLNILITDIYSLAAQNYYEALSLPLGSSIEIPLKFQNEHAHLFANDIEGIKVAVQLSHPRVVKAQLNEMNSTLALESQGSGECMVFLYLVNNPQIFDIFKVRVATIVQPSSPVFVHLGADVTFKIVGDQMDFVQRDDVAWSSSDAKILDINSKDGQAVAKSEGKADVLLSNNINAASIAHVSKVKHAEIDQSGNDLLLNVDEVNDQLRVRLKLYLLNQVEELMPIMQYQGMTLIRQNVGLRCISDQPDYVEAQGEVNDMEGFFCNIRYVGSSKDDHKFTPRKVGITVSTSGLTSAKKSKDLLYQEEVLKFDVKLYGGIFVEQTFKNGVKFGQFSRTKNVRVVSLSDFEILKTVDDTRLRVRKSRESIDSNHYNLTLMVPKSVNETFEARVSLYNSVTGAKTELQVKFDPRDTSGTWSSQQSLKQKKVSRSPGDQASSDWAHAQDSSDDKSGRPKFDIPSKSRGSIFSKQDSDGSDQQPSMTSYIVLLFVVCVIFAVIVDGKPEGFIGALSQLRDSCLRGWSSARWYDRFEGSRVHQGDPTRSFYSFRSANQIGDRSYLSRGSVQDKNPYNNAVRNRLQTSPDAKGRGQLLDGGGPYSRYSRGSVVSPQSMYRRAESLYREPHY